MKRIGILGVPVDLGASRRGTDMGPSALRYAKLHQVLSSLGCRITDYGNLEVPVPETLPVKDPSMKYAEEIVDICEQLADRVSQIIQSGQLPLVLGGDHSLSMGTLAGVALELQHLGLIWIDAHGDFNTPSTSPSGNVHGMSLAASVGHGAKPLIGIKGMIPKIKPEYAVIVGARQLDPLEREALLDFGVRVFTMKDIDELGMSAVIHQAVQIASGGGRNQIYLSFDLDVMDPMFARGVGTPVPGGLTYREAHLAMEILAESGLLCGLEMMEVNPILDQHNQTAELGVGLIASALGQKII